MKSKKIDHLEQKLKLYKERMMELDPGFVTGQK
jgi:hypothetical protein